MIEVKGGEKICVQDGRWTSTSRDGKVHNIHNPFEQAKNNAFSIMDYLKSQNVGFTRFVYGVAFPETVFSCKSISYAPEQIFDANNNNDFYTYLTKLKNYYGERDRSKDFRPPNKQEMVNIRRILGPNYEAVAPLRHLVV